jgi:hypothetical protein
MPSTITMAADLPASPARPRLFTPLAKSLDEPI